MGDLNSKRIQKEAYLALPIFRKPMILDGAQVFGKQFYVSGWAKLLSYLITSIISPCSKAREF